MVISALSLILRARAAAVAPPATPPIITSFMLILSLKCIAIAVARIHGKRAGFCD